MKIEQEKLIEDLLHRTQEIIKQAEMYNKLSADQVNWKPQPGKWSVLECLEHLNLYGDFYLVELEKRILNANHPPSKKFMSGFLGNYFATSMLSKNGRIKKMKTFRDKDPINTELPRTTIDRFLKQQQRMKDLLNQARSVDLNKVKTSISIPVIKLKLGDTFRFVIFHNQRHMLQVEKVIRSFESQPN